MSGWIIRQIMTETEKIMTETEEQFRSDYKEIKLKLIDMILEMGGKYTVVSGNCQTYHCKENTSILYRDYTTNKLLCKNCFLERVDFLIYMLK